MKKIILAGILCLLYNAGYCQTATITTFAGTGTAGYSGDGSSAVSATMRSPNQIVKDAAGNTYFADRNNDVVRKINTAGVISTFAGTGTAGYSGDSGPAASAKLNDPIGLAFDASGNLYISDHGNSVIRKVTTGGTISTFAGGGAGATGDGGSAIGAGIVDVFGLACDNSGNLFLAQQQYSKIRKIVLSTGIISTHANLTSIPQEIAADGSGNLFVALGYGNYHIVQKITSGGTISTFAGTLATGGYNGDGGLATGAELNHPIGVALDNDDNLYIADSGNHVIRKVNRSTGIITTFAGNGTSASSGDGGSPTSAAIGSQGYIMCDGNHYLYIGDAQNFKIRRTFVDENPSFTGGGSQNLTVCQNSAATSINSLLQVTDGDVGDNMSWTVVSGPSHGTLVAAFSSTSTGGTLTPTTRTYQPTAGYSGSDAFTVRISDGYVTATTTINVTVNPFPTVAAITGTPSVCVGTTTALADATMGGTWSSSNANTTVNSSGVVTGVTVGSSTISYAVTNSCGTTTVVAGVTISDLPSVAAITGTNSVCVGATTALANATGGGTWSSSNANATVNSSGVVTGVTAGSSTISYAVSNSCGTTTVTTDVTISDLPSVAAITGTTSVCAGSTTALANATGGGTWSSSNANATVNSSGLVTGVTAGSSTISYAVTNSCGTTTVTTPVTINPLPNAGVVTAVAICRNTLITLTSTGDAGGTWSTGDAAIVAINSTTGEITGFNSSATGVVASTIITYTVTNGCGTASDTAMITVKAPPRRTGGSAAPCVGVPDVITFAPAGGLLITSDAAITTISGNTATITPVTAGTTTTLTYTFIPGNATSCGVITPAFNSVPYGANTITGPNTVRLGGTITLSAANSNWNTTPSSTSVGFLVSGSYASSASGATVTITTSGTAAVGDVAIVRAVRTTSCLSSDTQSITVICPTCKPEGEGELTTEDGVFSVYPNPCRGSFTIDLPSSGSSVAITVTNLIGKIVATRISAKQSEFFDLGGYPHGMYIISVTAGDKKYREKVLIE